MAERFNLPTLVASLLMIPVIAVEKLKVGEPWRTAGTVANWAIWLCLRQDLSTRPREVRRCPSAERNVT